MGYKTLFSGPRLTDFHLKNHIPKHDDAGLFDVDDVLKIPYTFDSLRFLKGFKERAYSLLNRVEMEKDRKVVFFPLHNLAFDYKIICRLTKVKVVWSILNKLSINVEISHRNLLTSKWIAENSLKTRVSWWGVERILDLTIACIFNDRERKTLPEVFTARTYTKSQLPYIDSKSLRILHYSFFICSYCL